MINERSYGMPKDMGHYWEWHSGRSKLERNVDIMPKIIEKIKPEFIMTIDDLDTVGQPNLYKDKNLPWIQYFPIDNHDIDVLHNTTNGIYSSDISVCMSKFGYDLAKDNQINIDKYIYPFIDTEIYHKFTDKKQIDEVENFRKMHNLHDKKVLLFVGRPGWRKNVEFLIGAFKKLVDKRNDVALFLHMDFNDPCAEFNIWKLIYSMDLPPDLITRFVGFDWHTGVPKRIMSLLYNVADVYISTHGGEGFGLPICEAMASEVPGVITDCTTTPELYKEGDEWVRGFGARVKANILDNNVMRPFVDINDFVEKIEILLDDESLRKDMGKKGREWVQKNCSVPVITRKWKRLFRRIDVQKARIIG